MFYSGDLQSGISKAIQESKVLACFVTDDGEESQAWENDFLQDPVVKSLLSSQTILLRLSAGSQEASHLAAIFPVPKTPTLVLLKNGDLKEYVAAGVSKEDFLHRIGTAFQSKVPETPSRLAAASRSVGQGSVDTTSSTSLTGNAENAGNQKTAAELKGKGREEPIASKLPIESSSKNLSATNYALQRKKEQNAAREERARILALVEADKIARRAETERRAQARAQPHVEIQVSSTSRPSTKRAESTQNTNCAIQVRLFDGSAIRSQFPSKGSLRKDVRPWVDSKQKLEFPYNFKQVLTPLPNKDILVSEEEEDLQQLGLAPSATLILVPIKDFTPAYPDGPARGLLYSGGSYGYNLICSGLGLVSSTLGSIFGSGRPSQEGHESTNAPDSAPAPSSRINGGMVRDREESQEDQQFYNGNALNFEPNQDEQDSN
ncbi:hypothetical protein BJ875DRAFT_228919 [Amylocarpus encephaloides]|uniref:UBX domain-containing protein 2 n=1 Tax=Amylocarpus encephaloides TaxID=45428 RepID=A0A9P7Y7U9_9HELO|nr:hypothetical protein BJ875DRAFT_228919 [Amylocarpus encephaloides]